MVEKKDAGTVERLNISKIELKCSGTTVFSESGGQIE
jgi:hypothetical protein